jgi:hypothetical protein
MIELKRPFGGEKRKEIKLKLRKYKPLIEKRTDIEERLNNEWKKHVRMQDKRIEVKRK